MSNDPFEELFGEAAPEPVPARQRLAQEQAERLDTAQLPQAAGKPKKNDHPAKPWVIVGIIAVAALIASAVAVNAVRGGDPEPTPAAAPTNTPTSQAPEPTSEGPEPSTEPEPDDGSVPQVEVGTTFSMDIDAWDVKVDASNKLGYITYKLDGENLVVSGGLIDDFAKACPSDSGPWGMTRVSGTEFTVLKPAERCSDAPELYDELWGQLDAMANSAQPL